MDSFFTATGASPPSESYNGSRRQNPHPPEPEPTCPLPEELVEALAGLLAQALVNDIRQYFDLRDLTLNGTPVAARPGAGLCPKPSTDHPHSSTRSRTRGPAHAS